MSRVPVLWTFEGFVTDAGKRVVQEWFHNELDEEGRDAIIDRIAYLQILERHMWKEPHFKCLDGDLGEIRTKTPRGALRVYGHFRVARHFLFVSGNYKAVTNDKQGKKTAKSRLKIFKQGKGGYHDFDFQEKSDPKNS